MGKRGHTGVWSEHPAALFSNGSHIRNLTESKDVGWPRNGMPSAAERNMRPANQCPAEVCQFSCPAHGLTGGRRGFRTASNAGWLTATETGRPDFHRRNREQLSVRPSSQPSNLVTDIRAPRVGSSSIPRGHFSMQVHCKVSASPSRERRSLTSCKSWDCSSGYGVVGAARLRWCQVRWQSPAKYFTGTRYTGEQGQEAPRLTDGELGEQAHGPGSPVSCGLARWRRHASSGNVTREGRSG